MTNETESDSFPWAIQTKGLSRSFGSSHALQGIDLKVGRGEHLTIFGPNGAGKTTLVKVLSTLSKPSAGKVWLEGRDIRDDPIQTRRKVSLVSHQAFLYDDLTVYENLKFYGKMYDVPALEQRIHQVISMVQLESRLHDRVRILSHGTQKRVSIARAVIHNPPIMFLDEPEAGLDPQGVSMLKDVLDTVNTPERTVVMTTHNLQQGIDLGNRVVILNKGRIVFQALKDQIDVSNFQEIYDRYTRGRQ